MEETLPEYAPKVGDELPEISGLTVIKKGDKIKQKLKHEKG